jgi:hypothetical protein
VNGHRETWPIRSKGFRRWLARCFYGATQGAPSSEALASALNVIEAKAHFDAPECGIAAFGPPAALAAKAATPTIPTAVPVLGGSEGGGGKWNQGINPAISPFFAHLGSTT